MTQLFREKNIKKTYWAIVQKRIKNDKGTLVHFLKKNKRLNKSFAIEEEKKGYLKSILRYKLINILDNYFVYEINLISGRHHQIRAQLSTIGSPIKGDVKYGAKRTNPDGGINLHSKKIQFIHPIKKEIINIEAAPPNDRLWTSCLK